jgi:hypothetical protein
VKGESCSQEHFLSLLLSTYLFMLTVQVSGHFINSLNCARYGVGAESSLGINSSFAVQVDESLLA